MIRRAFLALIGVFTFLRITPQRSELEYADMLMANRADLLIYLDDRLIAGVQKANVKEGWVLCRNNKGKDYLFHGKVKIVKRTKETKYLGCADMTEIC